MANELFERVLAGVITLASSSKVLLWNANGGPTKDARFLCKQLGIHEMQLRRIVLALAQDRRIITPDGRSFSDPMRFAPIRQAAARKAKDDWKAAVAAAALGDAADAPITPSSTKTDQERPFDPLKFLEAHIEDTFARVHGRNEPGPRSNDTAKRPRRSSPSAAATRTDAVYQPDVLGAIDDELRAQQKAAVFVVEAVERRGQVWVVTVQPPEHARGSSLDESSEDASAWWPGPNKGTANVLSVIPEESQIALRFLTAPPPKPGGKLFLFPPRYLESLRAAWADPEWAVRSETAFLHVRQPSRIKGLAVDALGLAQDLRHSQKQALALTRWQTSFLWGPPGTGKTFSVGRLLASVLQQHPAARILLLSTTNNATDLALCAVDDALRSLGRSGDILSRHCKRAGRHFESIHYRNRAHLLPTLRTDLVARLAKAEAEQPNKRNVEAFHAWKEYCESLRALLREHMATTLRDCRLGAVTTTAAAFALPALRELPPYDLVVFDEASQVSLAHALALCPLGRRVLFAGDPKQLAPIVQSDSARAAEWLGQSPFALVEENHDAMVFLDEQSRMAPGICELIENIFYRKGLKVAADQLGDPEWCRHRSVGGGDTWNPPHVRLHTHLEDGTWSRKLGGPIRPSSADRVVTEAMNLSSHVGQDALMVLTPFRAQRALIRARLREAGLERVKVNTVHRAQGSEMHTVLFDPVDGSSRFFDAVAERLVNVAISRTQARLVLFISESDLANPILKEVAAFISSRVNRSDALRTTDAKPATWWSERPDFPQCMVGQTIVTRACLLTVRSVSGGIVAGVDEIGLTRRFKIDVLVERAPTTAQPNTAPLPLTASPGHRSHEDSILTNESGPDDRVPTIRCEPHVARNVRHDQEKARRADAALGYLAKAESSRRGLGLPKASRRKRN